MHKRLAALAAAGACALSIGLAGPASANSFDRPAPGGSYSYNDGLDRFCVHGGFSSSISVRLVPVSRSGPSVTVSDYWNRGACSSALVRAYEDTRYKAVVTSYTRSGTSTSVYYFWS